MTARSRASTEARVVELHALGLSIQAIADEVWLSDKTVARILDRMGVQRTSRAGLSALEPEARECRAALIEANRDFLVALHGERTC